MIWIIIALYALGAITTADWIIEDEGPPSGAFEWASLAVFVIGWPVASPALAARSVYLAIGRARLKKRSRINRSYHK